MAATFGLWASAGHFGTVLGHMTAASGVYLALLRAVERLNARVLLTVGRRFDPAELGPVSQHVHIEQWVDQVDAFAEASLVVCHGGSGTTLGALAAGLPMVVVPMFADQFANARNVAHAGAGVTIFRASTDRSTGRNLITGADAEAIEAAIKEVLATPRYQHAAERVADEMRRAPDPGRVIELLMCGPSASS